MLTLYTPKAQVYYFQIATILLFRAEVFDIQLVACYSPLGPEERKENFDQVKLYEILELLNYGI